LQQIRQDWTAIIDRMVGGQHSQLWEWRRDYLDTIADDSESAFFIVAYREEVPLAVLPLCASNHDSKRVQIKNHQSFASQAHVSFRHDLRSLT
jgi:transposase-like protein